MTSMACPSAQLGHVFATAPPIETSGSSPAAAHAADVDAVSTVSGHAGAENITRSFSPPPVTIEPQYVQGSHQSPAEEILAIFRTARPDVTLVPQTYPVSVPPTRQWHPPPILMPSTMRLLAGLSACRRTVFRPVGLSQLGAPAAGGAKFRRGQAAPAA
ncbi:hypothetical protein N2152v2_003864 [Parachlorella kessleri]